MKAKLSYAVILIILIACESEKIFTEKDYTELQKELMESVSLVGEVAGERTIEEQLISRGKKDNLLLPTGSDFIFYRLYVNNEGIIDKVNSLNDEKELSETEKNNIAIMSGWKFHPVIYNEVAVCYTLDFTYTNLNVDSKIIDKITNPSEEKSLEQKYPAEFEKGPEIMGGVQQLASLIKYPPLARNSGLQGSVFIKAYITETGDVERISILRGMGSGCDVAAAEAVLKTKFTPAIINGKPAEVQVVIPIKFKLADK